MPENRLIDLSKQFAVDTVLLCEAMRARGRATAIINQLLRSGTGIGANIHEATYASSRADFVNKFQIALKECHETEYWLCVFRGAGILAEGEYRQVFAKCGKIRRLLVASVTTAKRNGGDTGRKPGSVPGHGAKRGPAQPSAISCPRGVHSTRQSAIHGGGAANPPHPGGTVPDSGAERPETQEGDAR